MKNNKTITRIVSAALAAAMSVSLLAACGDKSGGEQGSENLLTYWSELNNNAAVRFTNNSDTKLAQELEKRLDVEIEYTHPPQGQSSEKFSIMVASDELPDIIEYNWLKYPGGPDKAIKEGVIREIDLDKAPNLKKYLDENPNIKKLVTTDSGKLFSFPFIRGDKTLCVSAGMIIREDWLKELNLELPETMDEWENVLTAFKEKKGIESPLCLRNPHYFASAYDTSTSFYVDNGTIKYGFLDPQFKDYLMKLNDWYKKGLLDQSFATLDSKSREAKILNGKTGATYGSIGSGIGKLMASATEEGYSLAGAPIPVPNKGDVSRFGTYQNPVTAQNSAFCAISTTCENLDAAYKLLDYGYSEEGRMLYNFGIEGQSYNMIDGYPTYTEEITNNAEGFAMTNAMADYMRSFDGGPFVQDKRYMEQYGSLPQQKQAWEVWSKTNADQTTLPHLYMKEEEQTDFAQLSADVTTYAEEMFAKFIIGSESFDKYDAFIAGLKSRGVDKLLAMYQSAYGRYLKK